MRFSMAYVLGAGLLSGVTGGRAGAGEPSEETRKQAAALVEFIEAPGDAADKVGKYGGKLRPILDAEGAVPAVLEALRAHGEPDRFCRDVAEVCAPLLKARHAEAVETVRPLFKESDDTVVQIAAAFARWGGLAPDLLDDIVAAMGRRGTGTDAAAAFEGCADAGVESRLETEATKRGITGDNALWALARTRNRAARPFLRRVASDGGASVMRRLNALGGLLDPDKDDQAVLEALLTDDDPSVARRAAQQVVADRVRVSPEAAKKGFAKAKGQVKDDFVKVLCLAGDAQGFEEALNRSKAGSTDWRVEWLRWAGVSGVPEAFAALSDILAKETEIRILNGALVGLGETGNPSAIALLRARLPDASMGTCAFNGLALLGRRTPESLGAVLDAVEDPESSAGSRISTFVTLYQQDGAKPEELSRLFEELLRRAEAPATTPALRKAALGGLGELKRMDFGDGPEAAAKWRAWWKEHEKDAFSPE